MDDITYLDTYTRILRENLPCNDKRAKIQSNEFVSALILCFSGESKQFSLESMRREMMGFLKTEIPSSSFWDRLSRPSLTRQLQNIIGCCMGRLEIPLFRGETFLSTLNVKSIDIVDSTSISLWDPLKDVLPGTRTTAGVKWHSSFNLFTGSMNWFNLSSTSSHDLKHFPDMDELEGRLTVFDLGYYNYDLFKKIDDAGGFFLSRIKKNSDINVLIPIQGVGQNRVGCSIQEIKSGPKIIDFVGEINCKKHGRLMFRVVGFWNKEEKKYHFYVTNLTVAAELIYPLYRCRWQVEIVYKGCKSNLNLDKIPTGNKNIVMNLILVSILAYIASLGIVNIAKVKLNKNQRESITPQRIAKVMVRLSFDFADYLIKKTEAAYRKLKDKIHLFSKELFDPNYRKRKPSVHSMLCLCS